MPVTYTPSPLTYPDTIPIPVKGEKMSGASFGPPFQALANAAEWVHGRQQRDRDDVQLRRILESLLNPTQRWLGGTVNEKIRGPFVGVNGWYFVGLDHATSRKLLFTADGLSYSVQDFGGGTGLYTIVRPYANNQVLAVTSDGASFLNSVTPGTSPASGWALGNLGIPGGESVEFVQRLIDSNRVIAITGPNNYLFTSDDGITWTNKGVLSIEPNARIIALTSGYSTGLNQAWFALALGTKRGFTSPNWYPYNVVYLSNILATAWVPQTVPNCRLGYDLKYTGVPGSAAFLLVGEWSSIAANGVWRSPDAQTWSVAWNDNDINSSSRIIRSPYGQVVALRDFYGMGGALYYRERDNWGGKLPPLDRAFNSTVSFNYPAFCDAGNGQSMVFMDAYTSDFHAAIYTGRPIGPVF